MKAAVLLWLPLIAACTPDTQGDPGNVAQGGLATPDRSRLDIAPLELGSWYFRSASGQSVAMFGPPGGAPIFTIRCDVPAGQVQFVRSVRRHERNGTTMTLVAERGEIALPVKPVPGERDQLAASLPVGAPFVTTLASGATRLSVTINSGKAVTMPGDPVVSRAVLNCA